MRHFGELARGRSSNNRAQRGPYKNDREPKNSLVSKRLEARTYYKRGSNIPQTATFCSFEIADRFRFLLKTETARLVGRLSL